MSAPTPHHVQHITHIATDAAVSGSRLRSIADGIDGSDFSSIDNSGKRRRRESEEASSICDDAFCEKNEWSFGRREEGWEVLEWEIREGG